MDLLSIKIKIADREYPMKVKPDEEARVRSAGKLINEKLRSYRDKFGIDDKEDLLAMVAKLKGEEEATVIDKTAENTISALDELIKETLS